MMKHIGFYTQQRIAADEVVSACNEQTIMFS